MKPTLLVLMAGVGGVGCYSDAHGADSLAEPLAICDGSADIRFGYDVSGGWITDPSALFFTQYGWSFAYVRGDCGYVAAKEPEGQFHTGVLSATQAEQLSKEVDYRTLDRRARAPGRPPCPDAPGERIHGAHATLHCTCCGPVASRVAVRLADQGKPVEAAVTVAVVPGTRAVPDADWPTWPLAVPITTFFTSQGATPDADDGVRVDDSDDAAALRALRDGFRNANGTVMVQDGGLPYELYVRDELPADMEAAVQALLAEREVPE